MNNIKIRLLYLPLFLAGLQGAAHAGLVKCNKPGGGAILQDTPCAPDASKPGPKRPVVGEKDTAFAQNSRPGANWDQRTIVHSERPRHIPPPQVEPQLDRMPVRSPRTSAVPRGLRVQEAETDVYNGNVMTQNRIFACRHARQQQEVVNLQRRIYHVDRKGEAVYADDSERAAISAKAQREVATTCN